MSLTLDTAYRDINSGAMFLTWSGAPSSTVLFSLEVSPALSDYQLIGTTTNTFMSDYLSKKNSIFFAEKHYRLRALDASSNVLDELLFVDDNKLKRPLRQHVDNILVYNAQLVLRNHNWAYDAYLIKPRHTGTPCTCYNPELRASSDPSCQTCYGTGFIGGYYDPIPVRVKIHDEQLDQATANAPIPTSFDIVRFVVPLIARVYPKDYLIVPDLNGRYICMNSNFGGAVVSPTQMIQTSKLDLDDPFYSYQLEDHAVSVDAVTYDDTTITVTGRNIFPLFGPVKLIFGKKDDLDAIVLSSFDLTSASQTKLVFSSPINLLTLESYEYRILIDLKFFDGVASHN